MSRIFLLISLFLGLLTFGQKSKVTILIDPGHGGSDPGHLPLNDSLKQEKYLVLDIAEKIGHYLTHNMTNVNVIYTRTDDSYPTLDDRVDLANSNKVDLLLSIHINGSPKPDVCGTESHVHDKDAKDAYKLARLIENQFKSKASRFSRGVKTVDDLGHSLQVLKYTQMPSVLVECGFITNEEEARFLNSIYGQEIVASAIFRATREYLQGKYPEINFVPPPDEPLGEHPEDDFVYVLSDSSTTNETAAIQPPQQVEPYYMVQIMASIDSVCTCSDEFAKLNCPVAQSYVESSSMYRYKYYVGPFASRREAKEGQKTVQELGYKDAFLVFFDQN